MATNLDYGPRTLPTDLSWDVIRRLIDRVRKFECKSTFPFFSGKRVQRLTSLITLINLWASSLERCLIVLICSPSENIVVSRGMRSSAVRVWLMNRFKAGKFERSTVSQKG